MIWIFALASFEVKGVEPMIFLAPFMPKVWTASIHNIWSRMSSMQTTNFWISALWRKERDWLWSWQQVIALAGGPGSLKKHIFTVMISKMVACIYPSPFLQAHKTQVDQPRIFAEVPASSQAKRSCTPKNWQFFSTWIYPWCFRRHGNWTSNGTSWCI